MQQVFAVAGGILVAAHLADEPGTLLAQRDSFHLIYEVANKRVARSVVQRHKDDDAAGSMTRRGYNHDRAVTVDVVALRKSEVWATFEPVFFVPYARKEFAKVHCPTLPDELVFLRRQPHGHAWKVGQAADVVPVRVGHKNGTQ